MIRLLRAATLVAALGFPAPAAPGLAESWFLGRARANMAIRNYAAAVEAYRKALAADPRSREASRGVGLALLGNGDVDLAVAELDRHLARFGDDAEVAFEQARLLQWARFAYRRADAARYLRMGLAVRDDPARRRDLARLLARQRDTVPAAIAEYDGSSRPRPATVPCATSG
jgi:cellulose synthase operon protein C